MNKASESLAPRLLYGPDSDRLLFGHLNRQLYYSLRDRLCNHRAGQPIRLLDSQVFLSVEKEFKDEQSK